VIRYEQLEPRVLLSDFGELPSGLPSALRLRLEESLRVEDSRAGLVTIDGGNYFAGGVDTKAEMAAIVAKQTAGTNTIVVVKSPPAKFGGAGPWNTPGASNTGPVAGTVLTALYGGLGTTANGQVIQDLAITGSGANANHVIQVTNDDVTIQNCTIDGNGMLSGCDVYIAPGITGTRIIDCSMTGTGDGSYVISANHGCGDVTISNCHIFNTAGSVFFLDGNNIAVENNWLERIGWQTLGTVNNGQVGDFHTDDVFIEAGSGYQFINNNFDTPSSVNIDGTNYSALRCFFIDPFNPSDVVGTVIIQNNDLDGGGSFMLQLMGQGTVTIANNQIALDSQYGIIYGNYVGDPIVWANNVLSPGDEPLSAPLISGTSLIAEPLPK